MNNYFAILTSHAFILPLWRDKTYKLYFNKQQDKSHIARDVKSFHAHLPKKRQGLFPAALSDHWKTISLSTISLITQSPLHTPECYAFFPSILRRLRLWLLCSLRLFHLFSALFEAFPCRTDDVGKVSVAPAACEKMDVCTSAAAPKCRLRVLVRPAR